MDARRTTIMAFATAEAANLVGLTTWQLNNWKDIVRPSWRSGAYGFRDLVALRAMSDLQDKYGVPTQQLRRAASYIRARTEDDLSGVKIGVGPKNKLYFFSKKEGVWESVDGSGQLVAEIALDHVIAQLKKEVAAARTRPRAQWGAIERTVGVCGNRERFAGTRIAVDLVVDMMRSGASAKVIREEFPTLQAPDIAHAKKLAAGE